MVQKVTGTATFGIDMRLPGMLFATVSTNPGIGGAMNGFDATAAEALPGVQRIVPVENGVAVVASNTWTAMQALDAIVFDWAPAPYPASSAEMEATLAAAFTPDMQDSRQRDDGDVEAALGDDVFEAEYRVPYLAHATMEPMTAAALLDGGKLTVWAGHQLPTVIADRGGPPRPRSRTGRGPHTGHGWRFRAPGRDGFHKAGHHAGKGDGGHTHPADMEP